MSTVQVCLFESAVQLPPLNDVDGVAKMCHSGRISPEFTQSTISSTRMISSTLTMHNKNYSDVYTVALAIVVITTASIFEGIRWECFEGIRWECLCASDKTILLI